MKTQYKNKTTLLGLSAFLLAGIILNACDFDEGAETKTELDSKDVQRGEWLSKGYLVQLQEVKQVKLDTDSAGFIIRVDDFIYRDNHFYAVSATNPEVIVYDSTGAYMKTIRVIPRPSSGCSFGEIAKRRQGNLLIKDIQSCSVYEVDSEGQVLTEFSTGPGDANTEVFLRPGGLDLIDTPSGRVLYSSAFLRPKTAYLRPKQMSEYLRDNLLIARFDEQGNLVDQFIKHSPIYAEYNLSSFQTSPFVIYENEIYLIEQALPYVRVFSLDGDFKRRFGVRGLHQRKLIKNPNKKGIEKILRYVFSQTLYDEIAVIEKIAGYGEPVIAVNYANAVLTEENLSKIGKPEPLDMVNYLMVYALNGELLVNDIELPGRFLEVNENSHLVLLLDNNPENLIVGLYSLIVEPAGNI